MAFDWWTLALQAINVLILVWLLGRFFYRPVAAMIEKRRTEAEKLLSDAEAARAGIDKAEAEIASARQGLAAERDQVLEKAKNDADAARAALLRDARKQADAQNAQSEAEWRRQRDAAEDALRRHAATLAVDISRRLLERLSKSAATGLFVESLPETIAKLSEQDTQLLVSAAGRSNAFEIISAAPLSQPQKNLCTEALAKSAGREPDVSFRVDPELIVGIEIRGADFVLDASWRNDLNQILKELTKDAAASAHT